MFVTYLGFPATSPAYWTLNFLEDLFGFGTRPLDCNASVWFIPGTFTETETD